jgi:phosphohistidine phosphatase
MKRITLLRHAKSSWDNTNLDDFQRPLNKRGERDAPAMGQRLAERNVRPTLIVSSDAVRAISTARVIARTIKFPLGFIQPIHALYLASPAAIIDVLVNEAERYSDVMVVGHNPGLTELVNQISDAQIDNIPTCGAFSVDVDIENWAELTNSRGQLAWHDYPKKPHSVITS